MTKVLLDQGLPRSSVIWLRQAGWDAVHVYEMGLSRARDKDILDYARAERRTCITLDADFHAIVAVANDTAPSVIRLRLEGLRGQGLAELILRIWPQIESQVRHGSDSIERYDRADKFAHYRRLTSLQDYVLVSQHRPLVEHFARHGEESILRMGEGLEAVLPLPAMGCELSLADIYDKVSFGRDDFMTDAK